MHTRASRAPASPSTSSRPAPPSTATRSSSCRASTRSSDGAAAVIADFVAAGGHAVVTFFSGIVDEHDRVRTGGYPGAFRELLGAPHRGVLPRGCRHLTLSDGSTATLWAEWVRARRPPRRSRRSPTARSRACRRHAQRFRRRRRVVPRDALDDELARRAARRARSATRACIRRRPSRVASRSFVAPRRAVRLTSSSSTTRTRPYETAAHGSRAHQRGTRRGHPRCRAGARGRDRATRAGRDAQ